MANATRIIIVIFLIIAYSARTCDGLCLHYDCWSWTDKPLQEEIVPEEPETFNIRIISNILMWFTIVVSSVRWLIEGFKAHIELGVCIIIFWLAIKLLTMLRQGRPTNNDRLSSDSKSKAAKATAHTPVTTTTNIHICNRAKTNTPTIAPEESVQSFPINLCNKPDKFVEGMDVETWVKQLEAFLAPIEKNAWLPIANTYINEKAFKRINCDKIKLYERFREQLVDAYTTRKSLKEREKSANIYSLKQGSNETVSEFGRKLISIAEETFPIVTFESLDEVLKENFIKGILDPRLRLKLEWKRRKMKEIKNQVFTIHDLMTHAQVAQQTYESESGSCTEDERALQILATQEMSSDIKQSTTTGAMSQDTSRLEEVMTKMLNHYEEAAREREEKRAYFESKNRSSYRNKNRMGQPQQESTNARGFQGSQWTPHEGSQRWPYPQSEQNYDAQQQTRNYDSHQPGKGHGQLQPIGEYMPRSMMHQSAIQATQGRPPTPPTAAARQ